MTTPSPLEVTLELDVPGEPIRGRICAKDAPARSFTGWLELTSRLTDLINAGSTEGNRDPTTRPA